jgi:hypothetical protein
MFEVPELGGAEVVVEKNKRGLGRRRNCGDLLHLAFAYQRGRIGPWPSLHHFGDNFGPGSGDQLAHLRQSCSGVTSRSMPRFNRGVCILRSSRKLSRFARKCSGTGQRLRTGDELHPDQERSIRLNARGFQETSHLPG